MKVEIDRPIQTGFFLTIGAILAAIFALFLLSVLQFILDLVLSIVADDRGNSPDHLLVLFAFLCVATFIVALVVTKSKPPGGNSD